MDTELNQPPTSRGEITSTIFAGTVAAAVFGLLSVIANAMGLWTLDFGRILGTFFLPPSPLAVMIGWIGHLASGAIFAVLYLGLFRLTQIRPSAIIGGSFGFVHAFLSMAIFAVLPTLHPRPAAAGLERFTLAAFGDLTVPGLLIGHIVFGAVVGHIMQLAERQEPATEG